MTLNPDDVSALVQLRAYLAQQDLSPNARLPPERELCGILGVRRGELRKALAVLEREGQLWRHVGKGTFLGARPRLEVGRLEEVIELTNPREVMRARLVIEPEIAREATLSATAEDVRRMHSCMARSRECASWREYENWDNQLHRTIAEACRNAALLHLFDTLNAIRRAVVWGRLRKGPDRPPPDHHSFAEHEAVVRAIEQRDQIAAPRAMHEHLRSVERHLFETPLAAE
jgi:DNA-binding FadR family transcriptional regulator